MTIDPHKFPPRGTIALMGSGELTATMVSVHKQLIGALPAPQQAVFLDTPAGFQLNADEISRKAQGYFEQKIQHSLDVATYKQPERCSALETEQAYARLRAADYILLGPGSPSYTVQQLIPTAVPEIFYQHVCAGGCLTAASAAALTVGQRTLPVYEIYKVGQAPHWMTGLDILGRCGIDLAVIPHWNNAEGGTHDTRFCFMGRPRLLTLEALLEDDLPILGIDEHTVCVLDFDRQTLRVGGLGKVVLRMQGHETVFEKGRDYPLDALAATDAAAAGAAQGDMETDPAGDAQRPVVATGGNGFWPSIHRLQADFDQGRTQNDTPRMTNVILELDRVLWQAHQALENEEAIAQGREILRELIVLWGTANAHGPDFAQLWDALMLRLLGLRQELRDQQAWQAADALRDTLQQAGVLIEDTPAGPRWKWAGVDSK